jgi:hypothetical protein
MLSSKKSSRSSKESYLKTRCSVRGSRKLLEQSNPKKNSRHEIVIITGFLSTVMAAENYTPTKNPKTQTIRKMLDQEGPRITLPSHKGIGEKHVRKPKIWKNDTHSVRMT